MVKQIQLNNILVDVDHEVDEDKHDNLSHASYFLEDVYNYRVCPHDLDQLVRDMVLDLDVGLLLKIALYPVVHLDQDKVLVARDCVPSCCHKEQS